MSGEGRVGLLGRGGHGRLGGCFAKRRSGTFPVCITFPVVLVPE